MVNKRYVLLSAAALIAAALVTGVVFVHAGAMNTPPPPPPSGGAGENPGTPPPPPGGEKGGPPPPPVAGGAEGQRAPPPPGPPGPPAEVPPPSPPGDARDRAEHELRHAYDVLTRVVPSIISYARNSSVEIPPEVTELKDLATQLYSKALSYYRQGEYSKAEVYAHLAVEVGHGAERLVRSALEKAGVAPPPPPPPVPP